MTCGSTSNQACSESDELAIISETNIKRSNADDIRNVSKSVKQCILEQEEECDELDSLKALLDELTVVNKRREETASSVKKKMDYLGSKL